MGIAASTLVSAVLLCGLKSAKAAALQSTLAAIIAQLSGVLIGLIAVALFFYLDSTGRLLSSLSDLEKVVFDNLIVFDRRELEPWKKTKQSYLKFMRFIRTWVLGFGLATIGLLVISTIFGVFAVIYTSNFLIMLSLGLSLLGIFQVIVMILLSQAMMNEEDQLIARTHGAALEYRMRRRSKR